MKENPLKKDFDRVIPLRPSGNLRAIFCLPPGGGPSWSYAGLLPAIEVNRPIYGLEASDSEICRHPETIEATAEEYLTIIRRIQGQGPYHLLGWSLGGLVAHSVACQLQLQNQDVGLLALLDAYPYSPSEPTPAMDRECLRKQLVEGMTKLVEPDARHTTTQPLDLSLMIKAAHQAGLLAPDVEDFERVVDLYEYLTKLRREFRPSRFHGNLLLFIASDSDGIASPDVWTPYVNGEISKYRMNCRHVDMGKPLEMALIGRTLATYLQAIDVYFTESPSSFGVNTRLMKMRANV